MTLVKDQSGHGLKFTLIGSLHRCSVNKPWLLTMTAEHQTGINNIVGTVHRFLTDEEKKGPLPRYLFLQFDNCSRENRNKYLRDFMEPFLCWGLFDCVEVGFLLIAHRHSDTDQCFSVTSDRLKYHDFPTTRTLHEKLRQCHNEENPVECPFASA